MDIDEIIEYFNDGNLEIEKYFNDSETFFKIMDKRNRIQDLDLEGNYMENDYLYYLSNNNSKKFIEEVQKSFSNIKFEEGKVPVLYLQDITDLGNLFCDGRNNISQNTIKSVLDGDYERDSFYNTTDNAYYDVIEDLTPENKELVKKYILNNSDELSIEVDDDSPDLFRNYADDDGVFHLTPDNISDVVEDEESMIYLFDENYLDDLQSELESLHSNAYNSAYESEIYKSIWSELEGLFDVEKRKWGTIPNPRKKDSQIEVLELPILNFYETIRDYIYNNMGTSQGIDYYGDFIDILSDYESCLPLYPPDYPDSSEIRRNINELLGDYI
jgi:hypothetical protein